MHSVMAISLTEMKVEGRDHFGNSMQSENSTDHSDISIQRENSTEYTRYL